MAAGADIPAPFTLELSFQRRVVTRGASANAQTPHVWRQNSNLQRGRSAGLLFNPELQACTNHLCYAMRVATGHASQAPTLA